MSATKQSHIRKIVLCLTLLILAACLLLMVGTTLGRYLQQLAQVSYLFTPAPQDAVSVFAGSVTEEMIESGVMPASEPEWEQIDGGMKLQMSITNGTPAEFAQRHQKVCLQLAAGLAVEDPQNLTVTISYLDENGEETLLTGVPTAIAEGSFQNNTYGAGWNYRFYLGEEEHYFQLPGGLFSYQNITVTVIGDVAATLLDLQVTGQYSD